MKKKEVYSQFFEKAENDMEAIRRLSGIVEILRVECPWDKVQTHRSLRTGMIEEAYEVIDAIEAEDYENLKEELGDVLLQVVFHSQLADEEEKFQLTDVINDECDKMIRRHPHVFLENEREKDKNTIDKVLERWENIKAMEKDKESRHSIMEGIPKSFPALTRAYKIQKKAADVGFDWDDVSSAFEKIGEEVEELREQLRDNPQDADHIAEEMGDVLFSCVNVARLLGIDAELSLNYTNDKFIRRFSHIEECASDRGILIGEMGLSEMDRLWNEAKELESSN